MHPALGLTEDTEAFEFGRVANLRSGLPTPSWVAESTVTTTVSRRQLGRHRTHVRHTEPRESNAAQTLNRGPREGTRSRDLRLAARREDLARQVGRRAFRYVRPSAGAVGRRNAGLAVVGPFHRLRPPTLRAPTDQDTTIRAPDP